MKVFKYFINDEINFVSYDEEYFDENGETKNEVILEAKERLGFIDSTEEELKIYSEERSN